MAGQTVTQTPVMPTRSQDVRTYWHQHGKLPPYIPAEDKRELLDAFDPNSDIGQALAERFPHG